MTDVRVRQLLRAAGHRGQRHHPHDALVGAARAAAAPRAARRAARRPRRSCPGAVEEILRWANPLHYFRRTATGDTVLAGTKIAAGQKVAMMYTSANRDEAVFPDPHRFDIHRDPNPHLSFGTGEHFCLGVHLARLEGRVFFEELLDGLRHRADRRPAAAALEPQQRAQGARRSASPPESSRRPGTSRRGATEMRRRPRAR